MNPARPPIFPTLTAGRTLRVRAAKGMKRHPVTGRSSSDLLQRTVVAESPDWRHQ